jgi:hypothetical protein
MRRRSLLTASGLMRSIFHGKGNRFADGRRVEKSRSDVGVCHETYIVKPKNYEAIYSGMPPYGLGKVGKLVSASGAHEAARSRMTAGSLS